MIPSSTGCEQSITNLSVCFLLVSFLALGGMVPASRAGQRCRRSAGSGSGGEHGVARAQRLRETEERGEVGSEASCLCVWHVARRERCHEVSPRRKGVPSACRVYFPLVAHTQLVRG